LAAKVLARLRTEREAEAQRKWGWIPKWRGLMVGAGCAVLALGFFEWKDTTPTVSDRAVFAALDALVEDDAENRWWAGL
jgi:putative SOS response-associated peptidase YedK